ncbi:MAG: alpha/beta fold hydrolase [Burkholderiaceae bacterium]|nr:alpha/beta fold hydrolase [Burkholderiaceae bacterium]
MARLLLATLLLLQLATALAVGWGVRHWWPQGGPWGAALLALAGVLAVRLAINLNNFVLAARAASVTPEPQRLDWRGALRLFYTEFCASMLTTSWHMLRPNRNLHLASGMPVLLVHGYGCNSGYWVHLSARLRRAGISHMALDLEPIGGSIDQYADLLHAALERLCKAAGSPRAIIVAHSMGGLASRAYLRRHGAARVARVITLGTPHHGTALANFGPGVNAREMQLGSPWLAALAASETAATRALFVSLWSHHDNIIAPQDSSCLPGARNVAFSGIGHVALGADARILRAVLDEIDSIATEFNCAQ